MATPECQSCGKAVGRGIDLCQECLRLGRKPATCADCGVSVPGGKTYCGECGGKRLAALESPAPRLVPAGSDSFGVAMWSGAALGLLLALVGAEGQHAGPLWLGATLLILGATGLVVRGAIRSARQQSDRDGPPS